jgi:prepilin-type N-terminal cleavage/methylation domain-containing protein
MVPSVVKQKGFTLIEVLVAGFILFLVISATTLVYRGAVLSSRKAEQSLYVNTVLPLVMDDVKQAIHNRGQGDNMSLNANGSMAEVNFEWKADVTDYRPAPPEVIAEAGISKEQPNRFKLWQVELTITYKEYKRQFRYLEFRWNERLYS